MSSKSFFSLLVGLAAGAALGILYAPDKGKNTREKMKRAAAGGAEDIAEGMEKLGDEVENKVEEEKENFKDLGEKIKKKGSEIKEGARELLLRKLDKLEAALRKAEEGKEEAPEAAAGEEGPEDQQPQEQA